jgi:hypothetical protein
MHPATEATAIAGTSAATIRTRQYAATFAFAYVWGWPLVNNLNRSFGALIRVRRQLA